MIAVITSVCALVLAAVTSVALALLISRVALHQRLLEALGDRCSKLSADVEKKSPATLRAEVDDLRGALDRVTASNRREFGALWGKLGPRTPARTFDGTTGLPLEGDDELEAVIALQSAKPVGPNGSV